MLLIQIVTALTANVRQMAGASQAAGSGVNALALLHPDRLRPSVLCLCLVATASAAGPVQSLNSISKVAHEHLLEIMEIEHPDGEVQVKVNAPDARLRLAACSAPLEPFVTPGHRRGRSVSVGVSCAEPKPWKVYLRASISVIQEAVVAGRNLTKGEILTPGDLEIALIDTALTGDPAFSSPDRLLGMEVTRTVTAGRPIRQTQVQAPKVVHRGDAIVLVAGTAAFEVRMSGKALSSGAVGDSVSVQSNGRRQALQGRVVGPGTVRM